MTGDEARGGEAAVDTYLCYAPLRHVRRGSTHAAMRCQVYAAARSATVPILLETRVRIASLGALPYRRSLSSTSTRLTTSA